MLRHGAPSGCVCACPVPGQREKHVLALRGGAGTYVKQRGQGAHLVLSPREALQDIGGDQVVWKVEAGSHGCVVLLLHFSPGRRGEC